MAKKPVEKSSKLKVQLEFEKETAGAVRYREIDDEGNPRQRDSEGAVMSQLYLRKAGLAEVFGTDIPKLLTVTIEGQ